MVNCCEWINDLLKEVHENPNEKTIELIEHCGKKCALHQDALNGLNQLKKGQKFKNLTDYVEFFNDLGISAAEDDGGIVLKFGKTECTCPMVPEVSSPALCNCTVGHEKFLWGEFFEREVEIELLESILRGGDDCIIKIIL